MDKLRLSLAKVYASSQGKQIKGTPEIRFKDGRTKEAIVLEGEWAPIGQAIPLLNIIIVGAQVSTDFSENLRQFVLEHEYAHLKGWWWQLLLFPVFFCVGGFFLFGSGLYLISKISSVSPLVYLILYGVLYLIVLAFLALVTIWPIDFFTQWSAITTIGFDNAQKAIIEQKAKSDKMGLFERILNRLTHVPSKWILCLYKWVHN